MAENSGTMTGTTNTLKGDYFELFGLPQRFAVDLATLESAYRAVQGQVHPDRFASAGAAQRRAAMQWAAQANEAFQTLRQPLKRAVYLLGLHGVDVAAESNTAMAPAFLMQQMEWRETIDDAVAAGNPGALERLLEELRDEKRARYQKLGEWLDGNAYQPAAEAVRQLMFIERAEQEIVQRIERLEDMA